MRRTLLNTYTSHSSNRVPGGDGAPPGREHWGASPYFTPHLPHPWGRRKRRPPRIANRGLGGLPFFQDTTGHWEGMAPLRGISSGGLPLVHPTCSTPVGAAKVAPPTDKRPVDRGGLPFFQGITGGMAPLHGISSGGLPFHHGRSCSLVAQGGLPLIHGEPDCRSRR